MLRKRAPRVHDFHAASLKRIVDRMHQALQESHGIGIAAPQIGESIAVCSVLALDDDYAEHANALETAKAIVMINPQIIKRSKDIGYADEGCLSVPDYAVQRIPRAKAIIVEYQNMSGVTKRLIGMGMVARIMQHEIDHLNGALIIDYMKAQEDIKLATTDPQA